MCKSEYTQLLTDGALRQGHVYRHRFERDALRQEGHVNREYLAFTVDMALLTEGGIVSLVVYKHLPPDGGKMSKLKTSN